jgi:hypothetical protein
MMEVPKMRVKKRGDEWWILGIPDMDPKGCGPYGSKADAEDEMHGMERFYKYSHLPGYMTTEKPRKTATEIRN